LFNELKLRNVFKVVIAYIIASWLVLQVADVILNNIAAPTWIFHVLLLFLAIGFPFANLHSDPHWLPFLESIGKSPQQLAAIEFRVTLPEQTGRE